MSTVSGLSVGHICEIINKTEGGHYTRPYVRIIHIDLDDMNGQNIKVDDFIDFQIDNNNNDNNFDVNSGKNTQPFLALPKKAVFLYWLKTTFVI